MNIKYLILGVSLLFGGAATVSAEDPILLWDEAVDGDFSNVFESPTIMKITEGGEYLIRTETGPVAPVRRETPAPAALVAFAMSGDTDGDGQLTMEEANINVKLHFDTYDIDSNGFISGDELRQFTFAGDGHDLFDFDQAPGVNLVGIKMVSFDSGGPRNAGTPLVLIDTREDAPADAASNVREKYFESGSVGMSDEADHPERGRLADSLAIFAPKHEGVTEVYASTGLWKFYRRNDDTIFWRIGEGQHKAIAEIIYIFDKR